MISPTLDTLRIYLHLIAVAVWVGGQIVLSSMVPRVRRVSSEVMPVIARSFAAVSWPAMLIIITTGAWGLAQEDVGSKTSDYLTTLMVKLLIVGIAIAATLIHSLGTSKAAKALGAITGLVTSLGAAYLGVLLAHVG